MWGFSFWPVVGEFLLLFGLSRNRKENGYCGPLHFLEGAGNESPINLLYEATLYILAVRFVNLR